MEQHTPGPWKIAEAVESKRIQSIRRIRAVNDPRSDHGAVCEVYGIDDGTVSAANAALIAAAPELLESLSLLLEACSVIPRTTFTRSQHESFEKIIQKCNSTVTKARSQHREGS